MHRRQFLIAATLSGGGLLVGCTDASRQQPRSGPVSTPQGAIALNGWVQVGPDGGVGVVMPKAEMGQGAQTGLAMLVAEELDCAWAAIRLLPAPIDRLYGNVAGLAEGVPFRPDDTGVVARGARWAITAGMRAAGFMMTGGSSSVKDLWGPLREAAAVTRATLVEAMARHWNVAPDAVTLADGVFAGPGDRRATFADAVAAVGTAPRPAERWTLKTPDRFRVVGRPMPRLDTPAKVDATATFGLDVRPDGLLHAAIRFAPVRGGRVTTFDATRARALPGVAGVVEVVPAHGGSGGVAVVAATRWQAMQALDALDALDVQFDAGDMGAVSSASVEAALTAGLDASGFAFWKTGDVDAAIAAGARTLRADYFAPYLAHQTLEPMNCTVQFTPGRATVWVPTQVPAFAQRAAAKALDVDAEAVEVHVTWLGGGFGRRLEVDVVAQTAQIARAFPGRPVQLIWSRDDDTRHDFWRPACASRFTAALDATGRIVAWRNTSAGQAVVPQWLPRNAGLPGAGPDKTTAEGAFDAAYEFPNVRVAHATVDLPVPVGFWRGVGHSHQAFFKESFVDECAHAAGADPVAYRLALLTHHPRQAAVLTLAAARAGWATPPAPAPDGARVARGVALHESFGAIVAQIAEVSLGPDRAIRVHRVVCAIDCGMAVNPNLIAQQIEGGVAFGLSAALHGGVAFEDGRAQPGNFDTAPVLRIDAAPAVEVHIVPSTEAPEGVGEPGVPPVAPAVANAVFVLTGERLRRLPLALAARS